MSKAHRTASGAMTMAACLAMWAGCSQGSTESTKPTGPQGPTPTVAVGQQQAPVLMPTRVVTGPKAPHVQQTDRVLVEEAEGFVVRSERDSGGNITTIVYDGNQTRALFEQRLAVGATVAHIKQVALGLEMDVPSSLGVESTALSTANLAALRLFSMIPRDKNVTAYDGTGCDAPASKLTCSPAGACCDTHDYCYGKNECDGSSWIPGIGSADCKQCNENAAACVLFNLSMASQGESSVGPSSCCGTTTHGNNCGEDRPKCCETQPNGTCDCGSCFYPEDVNSGACVPPPPSPLDPLMNGLFAPCLLCAAPPGTNGPGVSGPVPRPIDPNDKVGPGTAEVTRAELWPYQINFENQDGATASAQEVVVVDYLDPNLDWATLEFGEIHYGGRTISIPQGAMDFTVLDTPPVDGCVLFGQGNLAVRVTLSMDMQTGRFEARLKVIDPVTNEWPDDPYAGILPPGLEGCSQGHVTFTAQAKADALTGAVIKNKADIVFDNNAPITTNEVSNTLVD